MIRIERAGPSTLVEDLGRPGLAHLGVSPSGAADRVALRLANRLVGNDEGAATLEVTLGGLMLSTDQLLWCAVTGPLTELIVTGSDGSTRRGTAPQSLVLQPGQTLRLAMPTTGLRNYLAVRGGLLVEPTLDSCSTDLLSGLGPDVVRAGDCFVLGEPVGELPDVASVPAIEPVRELWLTPGPRRDWLTEQSWRSLITQPWQVSPDSNRIGIRLLGPRLERREGLVGVELASEGLLAGAVQLPPSGQPLIFGPDHPITGGYPVIAVLTTDCGPAAGQLRAGDTIRLRERG